jgi:hypothetical protein
MALLEEAQKIIMELEEEHERVVIDWKDIFNPNWR